MADVQTPFWQSAPAEQLLPAAHRPQVVEPPQSLSVSPPFFALSEQVAAWQMLVVHTALSQSLAPVQAAPLAQGGQAGPPQSTSDSPWFKTLSVQLGARQVPITQLALEQSDPLAHFLPAAHFGQDAPPQSVSVSLPFLIESVQVAPAHLPRRQWPLRSRDGETRRLRSRGRANC